MTIKHIGTALALAAVSIGASATTPTNTYDTLYGVTLGTGSTKQLTFLGGVTATFDAFATVNHAVVAGKFNTKGGQGGYQGVGVSPLSGHERTAGEIDVGEMIVATFSQAIKITNFKVGLLFDGPEYGDVNEKAKITVTYANNSVADFYLTAVGRKKATWSGIGGSVANLSPAKSDAGGAWSVDANPFGNALVKSISFGATNGVCGKAGGACNNQSDYTFYSVTAAIPEPETYAMLLAGLAAVGALVRRKKQQA